MATILMIFLKINCPNFSRLVWRRHTKFQIGIWRPPYLPYRLRRYWRLPTVHVAHNHRVFCWAFVASSTIVLLLILPLLLEDYPQTSRLLPVQRTLSNVAWRPGSSKGPMTDIQTTSLLLQLF